MLNANDGLPVNLLKVCKRDLLCKLGGFLFLLSASTATAASNITELPDEMISAIRSAMQTHPDVMAADSKMLSAKSQVEAGGYRWYPKAEVAVRTGETGDRYSTVGLNQTLWDHGKINADFEAAKASELGAMSGKNAAIQSVGMAAAIAYLDVARAREQRAVAEENLNEHKKLHFSVLKRSDNGIGSKSDVTLTTSRLQQARAVERQWSGSVSRAEAVYLSVIGSAAAAGSLPTIQSWTVADGESGLISRVVTRSPSLQKLREEVKVAEATVESKKALLYPTLYARVDNTRYFGSGPFDSDTRFSVNFQWQNDVALTQRFQVEAAQHMVDAAKHALESEERVLVQTSSNYWSDYTTALSRSEELEKFAVSAAETVKLFKRQFTIGRRSWPEVTNTLQDLYSANSQRVDAKYAVMTARMQLAFVGGEMDYLIDAYRNTPAK